jgi:hypothetical protein
MTIKRLLVLILLASMILISITEIGTAGEVNLTLEGHIGGRIFTNDVSGSYAYIGQGQYFVVIDISDPTMPSELGRFTTNDSISGIKILNNYAYVTDGDNRLVIVDISAPSTPYLIGNYDTVGCIYNIEVSGNYAYIANGHNGLVIVDISDLSTPCLAGNYDTVGGAAKIAFYLAGKVSEL